MSRLPHGHTGHTVFVKALRACNGALASASSGQALGFAVVTPTSLRRFDFLFPDLQGDPDSLLPEDPSTPQFLIDLGATMMEPTNRMDDAGGDGIIPAAYTYLGQFIDHDITLEAVTQETDLFDPQLKPMSVAAIRATLVNSRTATLDLDSVYGLPAPGAGDRMDLGTVSPTGSALPPLARPPGKDDHNDVPREPPNPNDPRQDRAALVGDPRNDENTIISQLHLAFLRAHNALVDRGLCFDDARRVLRQHYQQMVLEDFLVKVAGRDAVADAVRDGARIYDSLAEPFFLPLEFSVAAFRFGHSMVRGSYNFNLNFNRQSPNPASLGLLFTFTALSGRLGGGQNNLPEFPTLPENWIIEWPRMLDDRARLFDTRLVEPLFLLPIPTGSPALHPDNAHLATRNLLRGYLLRMPTGQAVAAALGLPPLTPSEVRAVAASVPAPPGGLSQLDAIVRAGFDARTPLWYYLLAEAARHGGQRLGPVGARLIATVFVGLIRRSEDSILRTRGWQPTLPCEDGRVFRLPDLLRLAGVL